MVPTYKHIDRSFSITHAMFGRIQNLLHCLSTTSTNFQCYAEYIVFNLAYKHTAYARQVVRHRDHVKCIFYEGQSAPVCSTIESREFVTRFSELLPRIPGGCAILWS